VVSPAASNGASASMTPSTTAAGTMIHNALGAGSLATSSARDAAPVMPSPVADCTAAASRSCTTLGIPARASRRTMLAPMRPRPIIPRVFIRTSSAIALDHRRHFAQEVFRTDVTGFRLRERLLVPGPGILHLALGTPAARQLEGARGQSAVD